MPGYSVIVDCYSGHTYPERPVSFLWQGVRHEIRDIEKSWLEPGERHFKVRTVMNKSFHLCYNERHEEWSIIITGNEGENYAQRHLENTGK
jgi:hypothetical protein